MDFNWIFKEVIPSFIESSPFLTLAAIFYWQNIILQKKLSEANDKLILTTNKMFNDQMDIYKSQSSVMSRFTDIMESALKAVERRNK